MSWTLSRVAAIISIKLQPVPHVCHLYIFFLSVSTPIWLCWKCLSKMSTYYISTRWQRRSDFPLHFFREASVLQLGEEGILESENVLAKWNIALSLRERKSEKAKSSSGPLCIPVSTWKAVEVKSSQWLGKEWWRAVINKTTCDCLVFYKNWKRI